MGRCLPSLRLSEVEAELKVVFSAKPPSSSKTALNPGSRHHLAEFLDSRLPSLSPQALEIGYAGWKGQRGQDNGTKAQPQLKAVTQTSVRMTYGAETPEDVRSDFFGKSKLNRENQEEIRQTLSRHTSVLHKLFDSRTNLSIFGRTGSLASAHSCGLQAL